MWTAAMTKDFQSQNWVARLRGFSRERAPALEYCELCNALIPADHPHLVEPAAHRLLCVCDACAMILSNRADSTYRAVPRRARILSDFHLADAQWDELLIPIGMAFFFYSSADHGVIALYPGPAGATQSLLDLTAWDELVTANPGLGEIEPDVEALLVNRLDGAREYYRVPIDRCYALVGLIRARWRGLSGGAEAQTAIREFFTELRETADRVHAHDHT